MQPKNVLDLDVWPLKTKKIKKISIFSKKNANSGRLRKFYLRNIGCKRILSPRRFEWYHTRPPIRPWPNCHRDPRIFSIWPSTFGTPLSNFPHRGPYYFFISLDSIFQALSTSLKTREESTQNFGDKITPKNFLSKIDRKSKKGVI